MKVMRDSAIICFCVLGSAFMIICMNDIFPEAKPFFYNIERTTNYILSTQEIVSGQGDEIRELRHITDEFRAQIKGLQKEVLIGIQEGGM